MSKKEKVELGLKPCFVDGRTTYKSYLVVAVKPGEASYNAIGIKHCSGDGLEGQNVYKFHFWPNAEFFGLAGHRTLKGKLYDRPSGLSAMGYQSAILDQGTTETLLDAIKANPALQAAPRAQIFAVLHGGYGDLQAATAHEQDLQTGIPQLGGTKDAGSGNGLFGSAASDNGE